MKRKLILFLRRNKGVKNVKFPEKFSFKIILNVDAELKNGYKADKEILDVFSEAVKEFMEKMNRYNCNAEIYIEEVFR